MKKLLFILSATLFAACSGTIDPDDQGTELPEVEIPAEYTAPFTLSVDKSEVEADGADAATFSLKDAYDREMLQDKKALQSINIVSDKGTRVPRMQSSATFISNGEYTFSATFKGVKSENTVTVTARNRAKYEVYHRNIGLFKCTSVSCVACPNLGKILNGLEGEAAEHTVVLAIHGNFSGRDPFSMYVGDTDLGSYMISYFGGSGWPTLIYDLEKAETGSGQGSVIESNIMQRRLDHPATCGIKVESVQLEGSALKVNASMKSSTGGDYDLACVVVRDGLEYQGGYSDNNDGIYNHVVVNASESFLAYYQGEEVAKDEEISEVFTFDFGENIPSEAQLKDYYVAVYAHRKTGRGSTMDNIVTCAYGESVDYHLND
jgi:hypothetical protein